MQALGPWLASVDAEEPRPDTSFDPGVVLSISGQDTASSPAPSQNQPYWKMMVGIWAVCEDSRRESFYNTVMGQSLDRDKPKF